MDLEAAFIDWDTDGNGTLSKSELQAGLDRLGMSLVRNDFAPMFGDMDLNGDGEIDIKELKAFAAGAWAHTDDTKAEYSKQLTQMREDEEKRKRRTEANKLFSVQQMRRFKENETRTKVARLQAAGGGTSDGKSGKTKSSGLNNHISPTMAAQEKVRHFLIDRDIRYEIKAAEKKKAASRKRFGAQVKKRSAAVSRPVVRTRAAFFEMAKKLRVSNYVGLRRADKSWEDDFLAAAISGVEAEGKAMSQYPQYESLGDFRHYHTMKGNYMKLQKAGFRAAEADVLHLISGSAFRKAIRSSTEQHSKRFAAMTYAMHDVIGARALESNAAPKCYRHLEGFGRGLADTDPSWRTVLSFKKGDFLGFTTCAPLKLGAATEKQYSAEGLLQNIR
jgi:hypothetical protein